VKPSFWNSSEPVDGIDDSTGTADVPSASSKESQLRRLAAAPGFGEFDGEEEPARDCSG
jgi:hypothetical protein